MYASVVDKYGQCGPVHTFVWWIPKDTPPQSISLEYNGETEEWSLGTDAMARQLREQAKAMDPFLGPYPISDQEKRTTWQGLTSYIHERGLERVFKCLKVTNHLYHFHSMSGSTYSEVENELGWPSIQLTRSIPVTDQASLRTRYALDKSFLLKLLLTDHYLSDPYELMGDFQLAFLVLYLAQNIEGLEYWKRLLYVLCYSEEALSHQSIFYVDWMRVLWKQLQLVPIDFPLLDDEILRIPLQVGCTG